MLSFNFILPLMIIILTGNQLRALGFYNDGDISSLNKTVYWVILPPLLFRTTYKVGDEVLQHPNLLIACILCYFASLVVALVVSHIFCPYNIKRAAVSAFASFRSNNFYLGLPIIDLAMGDAGLKAASIYLAVSLIPYQLISIGAGEVIVSGRISTKTALSLTKNPLILACIAGTGASLAGIPMHFIIDEALRLTSRAATTVALLALGGTIDLSKLSHIVGLIRETWSDIFIKLFVSPSIMYLCLIALPVTRDIFTVSVMLSSMPSAVNCFIIAEEVGMDSDYAANLVAATTIFGICSIPAWAFILHMI